MTTKKTEPKRGRGRPANPDPNLIAHGMMAKIIERTETKKPKTKTLRKK